MLPLLTEQDIEGMVAEVLEDLSAKQDKYKIGFSQRIIFGGLCDEETVPIKLVHNTAKNLFVLFFSSHYLNNKRDKVWKLIARYILCTNSDGTFKTYNETMKTVRKITDGNHYESTYMADWLKCDKTHEHHIFCKKCNRTFYFPPEHDILKNPQNYKCDCGGQLMLFGIENCVSAEKKNVYFETKCTDRKINQVHDRNFFEGLVFEDKDMRSFMDFEKAHTHITRVQLMEELKRAIDNNQYNLLAMYNRAFSKTYAMANRYMPAHYKQVISEVSPVNYVETVKIRRKQIKPKLEREKYACDDIIFGRISDYYSNSHTIATMKKLIMEAVTEKNATLYHILQQVDKTQFDKSFRYMTIADKKKWKEFADGDLMQSEQ